SLRHYGSGYRRNHAAGHAASCGYKSSTTLPGSSAKTPMAQTPMSTQRYHKSRPSLLLAGGFLRRFLRWGLVVSLVSLEWERGVHKRDRHILYGLRIAANQLHKDLIVSDFAASRPKHNADD